MTRRPSLGVMLAKWWIEPPAKPPKPQRDWWTPATEAERVRLAEEERQARRLARLNTTERDRAPVAPRLRAV